MKKMLPRKSVFVIALIAYLIGVLVLSIYGAVFLHPPKPPSNAVEDGIILLFITTEATWIIGQYVRSLVTVLFYSVPFIIICMVFLALIHPLIIRYPLSPIIIAPLVIWVLMLLRVNRFPEDMFIVLKQDIFWFLMLPVMLVVCVFCFLLKRRINEIH